MKLMLSAGPGWARPRPHSEHSVLSSGQQSVKPPRQSELSHNRTARWWLQTPNRLQITRQSNSLATSGGWRVLEPWQDYFQNLSILSKINNRNPPPLARRGWLTLTISGGNAQILPPNGGCGGQTGEIVSGHNRWACSCCNNDKNNFLNFTMRKINNIEFYVFKVRLGI